MDKEHSTPPPSTLSVRDLRVSFGSGTRATQVLHGIDLSIQPGEIHGLVGESGSGKTLLALSMLGLLPQGAQRQGAVALGETVLSDLSERKLRAIRGARISMVFQEPMTALNPVKTIGDQIADAIEVRSATKPSLHERGRTRDTVIALLSSVRIEDPARCASSFPHMISGGERQRAMIAMAIANQPDIIIADEPTTALDVTVQAEILDLLVELVERRGMGMLFISHDLAVVGEIADRVSVLYAGRVVETGPVHKVLGDAKHPYTQGLMASSLIPQEMNGTGGERGVDTGRIKRPPLPVIPGTVPSPKALPNGCAFSPRCAEKDPRCGTVPDLRGPDGADVSDGWQVACWRRAT